MFLTCRRLLYSFIDNKLVQASVIIACSQNSQEGFFMCLLDNDTFEGGNSTPLTIRLITLLERCKTYSGIPEKSEKTRKKLKNTAL